MIERTNVWGTLTKILRFSMWAMRNIHVAPFPLPEVIEAGVRLAEVGLRLGVAGASLRERRAGLGQRGARLAELLVELGRVDLGQHLAGRDGSADIDVALADVAVGAGVDRGLLDRLDVARQHEIDRPVRPPRRP